VKVTYAKAFGKDLETIAHNPGIKKRLLELTGNLKATESPGELQGVRKIEGYENTIG
jgi:hypothetical protein